MPTLLEKSGTVNINDLSDQFSLTVTKGSYNFRVENTDNHGRFTFLIEYYSANYGEVPINESYPNLVKLSVEPGETKTGSFEAPRSIYGLSSSDPEIEANIENKSYLRISAKWIVTTHKAHYSFRITD